MIDLHVPWLAAVVFLPLFGAAGISRVKDADTARKLSVVISSLTLLCSVGAWADFHTVGAIQAGDRFSCGTRILGREVFVIDELSAPLLPMTALIYCLTFVATLRTKVRRFRFVANLAAEAVLLATFCSREPWIVIGLLALGTVFPSLVLRGRRKSVRIYWSHMALYVVGMAVGQYLIDSSLKTGDITAWRVLPLAIAVLIRNGIVPLHCWVTDLFEKASFGGALLFVAPITGAYAAVRLLLPVAPEAIANVVGLTAIGTAMYAAAMSLIQTDCRRFFAYLFLSHSSLVLFGMFTDNVIGLTGALCVWMSVSLALTGFGLTLRAMESRCGRLSLVDFQGLYEHTPNLAMCFMLTGLASVGFPGTFGFVGTELLIDGGVSAYPFIGIAVVLVAAINGIAVVQTYFRLFTGTQFFSSVSLLIRIRERYAVLALATLILLGGIVPQPWVNSRFRAADHLRSRFEATNHEPSTVIGDAAERPIRLSAGQRTLAVGVASSIDHSLKE